MKVYSWKILLLTILNGGYIIWRFQDVKAGEGSAFISLIVLGYLFLKGLRVSFTKEGFEEDKEREKIIDKAYKEVFGPWAPIAPWGHLILITLSLAIFKYLPSQLWLGISLIIGSLVYVIVSNLLLKKHMDLEEITFEKTKG